MNPATDMESALLGVFVTRCRGGKGSDIDRILPSDRTRFFGYGRQALAEAFHLAGIGRGDEVLLPGFLCAEVLSSLATVGAIPRFYIVDELLHADVSSWESMPTKNVRAVLAINYFGFPQPLDQMRGWCRAHGATLIEDNAHGFLSSDGEKPLGRRGDLGVFSLRKTLALPNGGALVNNRSGQVEDNGLSFSGSYQGAEWRYRSKAALKRLIALGGLGSARTVISAIRLARWIATGSSLPASPPDRESVLPQEAFAPLTARLIGHCDVSGESRRRRDLYHLCTKLFEDVPGVRAIFRDLPAGVVPQGFPFLYTGNSAEEFRKRWWRRGVPIVSWPDHLPNAVLAGAPAHYHQVMLVQFLW